MIDGINETTKLAVEGSVKPLTLEPVVGEPSKTYPQQLIHTSEELDSDEVRVTVLGSGDPFVKIGQASASILIEVGNEQKDMFFFDIGSGALANFDGLKLPITSATKVFLTHLHTDHIGDMPAFVWGSAKAGRRDPVEVWGPASDNEKYGTKHFTDHLQEAYAWDTQSMCGHPGQSGTKIITTEVPFDKTQVIYERNGVKITSFPVIHIHFGAVGYKLEYAGRSVVFTGDTRPCTTVVEAAKGVDLLIHETFPSVGTYAKKASVPTEFADKIVNGVHTSPTMAGKVFNLSGARMSVMWHFVVDHDTVEPAYSEMREQYDGPVTIAQDLTSFNITKEAIVTRQAVADPVAWPVVGASKVNGPPENTPLTPPALWQDILLKHD
jgi:ribonuclease Z